MLQPNENHWIQDNHSGLLFNFRFKFIPQVLHPIETWFQVNTIGIRHSSCTLPGNDITVDSHRHLWPRRFRNFWFVRSYLALQVLFYEKFTTDVNRTWKSFPFPPFIFSVKLHALNHIVTGTTYYISLRRSDLFKNLPIIWQSTAWLGPRLVKNRMSCRLGSSTI